MNEQTFDVSAIPTTVEEFLALRNELSTTPQGGAVAYVVALLAYTRDPGLGLQCLTIAMDASELQDGDVYKNKAPSRMRVRELQDRVAAKPYVARSYFQGTSPENRYELPTSLQVNIRTQPRDEGQERMKVFVDSTGADSPRPIALLKNNRGIWKAKNYNSLDVGVRPPVEVVDDQL